MYSTPSYKSRKAGSPMPPGAPKQETKIGDKPFILFELQPSGDVTVTSNVANRRAFNMICETGKQNMLPVYYSAEAQQKTQAPRNGIVLPPPGMSADPNLRVREPSQSEKLDKLADDITAERAAGKPPSPDDPAAAE